MIDCLIVGGGIGGAVLALSMARAGHRVVILEREKEPPFSGRPEILAQATVEAFQKLGVGEKILQGGAWPLEGLEVFEPNSKAILRLDAADFRRTGFQPYSTDPIRVRKILLEEAAGRAELKRGVTVKGLIRKNGAVCGVQTDTGDFEARIVVGDDGGHSKVRESLGLTIDLHDFPLKFLVPRRFLPAIHPQRKGEAVFDAGAAFKGVPVGLFLPAHGQDSAFVYAMTQSAYDQLVKKPDSFLEQALRVTPEFARAAAATFRFPEDYVLVNRQFGHASAYVADGAALLGDAAHPVTPVGGQGANMSVHDAVALAETLERALKSGNVSAAALKSYEAERRPANERSIALSARAAQVFKTTSAVPLAGTLALRGVLKLAPANKDGLIRAISTNFLSRPH